MPETAIQSADPQLSVPTTVGSGVDLGLGRDVRVSVQFHGTGDEVTVRLPRKHTACLIALDQASNGVW